MFFKIGAKVIEAGDFLNIFLRFWVFEVNFLIKVFLIKKKTCMEIANENVQKHLGLFLDVKSNLSTYHYRSLLITIYKSRPHLDFGDII